MQAHSREEVVWHGLLKPACYDSHCTDDKARRSAALPATLKGYVMLLYSLVFITGSGLPCCGCHA